MIFNMTGGGGNPLNFKVVGGTTEPSNPKENTIWVNTDKEITGWHFASEQPEDMKEGEVWISIGTPSTVEFNALKKNGIQVYPISAKQHVSGAWVDVMAESYQNGEWVAWWNGYLFDNGNQYEQITGGWVENTQMYFGFTLGGDCTIGDAIVTTARANGSAVVTTSKRINLTNFSSLEVDSSNPGAVNMAVHNTTTGDLNSSSAAVQITNWQASNPRELDISTVDGEYYVSVGTTHGNANNIFKILLK